ncbi:hypothetical protein HKX48_005238 [Thoreauomyces humboldtii]|nr:hypothetical protein HKX48_005238 [Thoreauomyces humboldtii]
MEEPYKPRADPSDGAPSHHRSFLYRLVDPHLDVLRRDPTVLTTSTLVSPSVLKWFRIIASCWMTMLIPFNIVEDGETYLFYFTQLTYLGLLAWFATSAFQTHRYIRDGHMHRFCRQSKFTQWLTYNLYVMPSTFHWIVPIVFWSLLSSNLFAHGNVLDYWTNINVHAVDLVLILIELVLNRIPLFYSQWPSVIVTGLLFLVYAFFQHGVYHNVSVTSYPDGWWVYSFLDTSKPGAWHYYVLLPVGFVVAFLLVVSLHKLRDRLRRGRAVRTATTDTGAGLSSATGSSESMFPLKDVASGSRDSVEELV